MDIFQALIISGAIALAGQVIADALRDQRVTTTVIFKVDDGAKVPDVAPKVGT